MIVPFEYGHTYSVSALAALTDGLLSIWTVKVGETVKELIEETVQELIEKSVQESIKEPNEESVQYNLETIINFRTLIHI